MFAKRLFWLFSCWHFTSELLINQVSHLYFPIFYRLRFTDREVFWVTLNFSKVNSIHSLANLLNKKLSFFLVKVNPSQMKLLMLLLILVTPFPHQVSSHLKKISSKLKFSSKILTKLFRVSSHMKSKQYASIMFVKIPLLCHHLNLITINI